MQLHLWPRLDRMRSRSWRRRHAAFLAYTSSIEISEVMRVIYIYIHHVCESSCSWEEMPADLDSIAKMMVTLLIQQAGSAADALRGVHTEPPGPSEDDDDEHDDEDDDDNDDDEDDDDDEEEDDDFNDVYDDEDNVDVDDVIVDHDDIKTCL